MDLVTVVGGPNSNSYVSILEADEFFLGHVNFASWNKLSEAEKTAYLVRAWRSIDRLCFLGQKKSQSLLGDVNYQSQEWPRYPPSNDMYMLDIPYLSGSPLYRKWINNKYEPVIPDEIKFAQCEQAIFYLVYGSELESARSRAISGLTDRKTGLLEEQYSADSYSSVSSTSSAASEYLYALNCLDDSLRIDRG